MSIKPDTPLIKSIESLSLRYTNAAIAVVRHMKIRYSNEAGLELLGCLNWALCSKDVLDYVDMDMRDMVRQRIETLARTRAMPQRFQVRLVRSSGQRLWVDMHVRPVLTPKKSLYFIITAFDITDFKRVEVALRESEEKYRSLIDHSENPIVHYDRDNRVTMANRIAASRFGLNQKQLVGYSIDSLFPKDIAEIYKQRNRIVFESGNGFMVEDQVNLNGGSSFFLASIEPVRTVEGNVIAVQVISYDITRQKQNEKELKELNEKLERRVQQETKLRLDQQHMLLQQSKMAAMGEMIGAIAHQWRQPLNALALVVQGFVDYMETTGNSSEEVHRMENRAMKQIRHMSETIDDFRNFFRPARDSENFNLLHATRHVISLMQPQLRNNNIDMKVVFDSSLDHAFMVRGFPNEFQHVLMNIISNARDSILERARNAENHYKGLVEIELRRCKNNVIVTISDNGLGVKKEVLPSIFDPFFTTKVSGTGIGLYMSKMIIENSMKGRISIFSDEEGKEGAMFEISIPSLNNADKADSSI